MKKILLVSTLLFAFTIQSSVIFAQDLGGTSLHLGAKYDEANQGEQIAVYYVAWNIGSPVLIAEVDFYISATPNLNGTKIYLGRHNLGPIAANDYEETLGDLTYDLAGNFPPGNYYLLANVDPEDLIAETNELNNLMVLPIEIKANTPPTVLDFSATMSASTYSGARRAHRPLELWCDEKDYYYYASSRVGWDNYITSCTFSEYYKLQAKFDLPAGVKMKHIKKMTLRFEYKAEKGTSNTVKLVKRNTLCTGSNEQVYNCITTANGATLKQVNLTAQQVNGAYENKSIVIDANKYPGHLTSFVVGFVGQSHASFGKLRNFECDIEYQFDDFGCSQIQWWEDNVSTNASHHNVKDQGLVNEYGHLIYRTTSNKIGLAVKQPFGNYSFIGIGTNLNYSVASNIISNDVGTQYYYRTSNNELHCIYWTGTQWLWANLANAAGTTCSGHLAINSNNHIFYKTTSGGINSVYWNGSTWAWSGLNGAVTSGCAGNLVVDENDQIFYRTTSGGMNMLHWTGSAWANSTLNNAITSGVSGNLVANRSTNTKIFYKNTSGGLNCLYINGSVWAWADLSNAVPSGIAGDITVGNDGKVYYVKSNGEINYVYWTGSAWANASLTSGIGINALTLNGAIASGATMDNEGFYIESGNKLRRFYYGPSIGCDHSRSASSGDPLPRAENVDDFGSQSTTPPPVPDNLDQGLFDGFEGKDIELYTLGEGRYQVRFEDHQLQEANLLEMSGRSVSAKPMELGKDLLHVDLSHLPKGVYILQLRYKDADEPKVLKLTH